MKEKQSLLLIELLQKRKSAGGQECADALGISLSTFKRELNRMNSEFGNNGFFISGKTGRGNGYEAVITDQAKFDAYVNELKAAGNENNALDLNDMETRIRYLIDSFLDPDEKYLRMEDLADELLLSRTQLAKDLQIVRKFFGDYGLKIISRPHYGSSLEGDEKGIRECIATLMINEVCLDEEGSVYLHPVQKRHSERKILEVQNVLVKHCNRKTYDLNDITARDLSAHFAVASERITSGYEITFEAEMKKELLAEHDRKLAEKITAELSEMYRINFSEDELCFVIMHLCAKQMGHRSMITDEIRELVGAMLEEVRVKHQFDLTGDKDLMMFLGMHTASLLRRLHLRVRLTNPLLNDIRFTYIVYYDMALSACSVIAEKYHCTVSEDEAAYYALHFKIAADKKKRQEKKNILIVCSSGRGTAKMLDYNIHSWFGSRLNRVDTCNQFELSGKDYSEYDCVFTTVPLRETIPVPSIRINPFFDDANMRTIENALAHKNIAEDGSFYFRKELFFTDITAETKEEAIRKILEKSRNVRSLPDSFEESVFQREALQNTRVGSIALPRPYGIISEELIICFAILNGPVRWGGQNVQIVILTSVPKGFEDENKLFYRFIGRLSRSRSFLRALIRSRSYETLLDLYEEVTRMNK